MTTAKKVASNRANALKTTGPKTKAGKDAGRKWNFNFETL